MIRSTNSRWTMVRASICAAIAALLLLALVLPASAPAADIEWVEIGSPGNAPDSARNCQVGRSCGSVPYVYLVSKYEITNGQYLELLNAKAKSDPHGLYNSFMGSDAENGGIERCGSNGSYVYTVKDGFADKPVAFVSFRDAVRFANWVNNGRGSADTETGAYNLPPSGGSPDSIARSPGARVFVPSENEWYKAAFFSPVGRYFGYPAGSDVQVSCTAPDSTTNTANCGNAVGRISEIGAYPASPSPFGTFDQGGNLQEWTEQPMSSNRIVRGGYWGTPASDLRSATPRASAPELENAFVGIRLARLATTLPFLVVSDSDRNASAVWTVNRDGSATVLASGLNQPFGMAFGPDRSLFVANYAGGLDNNAGSISKVTLEGLVSPFALALSGPLPITVDGSGAIYVGLASRGRIEKFTPERSTFVRTGLSLPTGMCFGPDRWLYVTNQRSGTIVRIPPDDGTRVEPYVSGLTLPRDIACTDEGVLYVAVQNKIVTIDQDRVVSDLTREFPGGPGSLTFASDGGLYTLAGFGKIIYRVTSDGELHRFSSGFSQGRYVRGVPLEPSNPNPPAPQLLP